MPAVGSDVSKLLRDGHMRDLNNVIFLIDKIKEENKKIKMANRKNTYIIIVCTIMCTITCIIIDIIQL